MIRQTFEILDPLRGANTVLYLAGGIWVGEQCAFEFSDSLYGFRGLLRCDWREPGPSLVVYEGPVVEGRGLLLQLEQMFRPFHSGAFSGTSDAELEALYKASYHRTQGYASGSDEERARKGRLAELTITLTGARRVLVAGCSAGECLRQLRTRGVEAWGFDICPDLDDIVYPELRPYVRRGSLDAIPFGPEDGFDLVTAIDVFEHLPEDRVPRAVAELARLRPAKLVTLTASCEFYYPGHLTLRPQSWWDARLAQAFVPCAFDTPGSPAERMLDPGLPDATTFVRVYRAQPTRLPVA